MLTETIRKRAEESRYIFDDRLEVKSPGALLSTLTVEGLKNLSGVHQSRNTFIARSLREIGYMREIGEGVRRIYELMKSNELEEPDFSTDSSTFSVRLSNKALYSQQHLLWLDSFSMLNLSREEKAIVVMGYDGKVLSPNDILEGLGIVDTDDFRKLVTNLTDQGVLESTMPKSRASKIAQLSRINKRDVPRFKVVIPDPNKPRKQRSAVVTTQSVDTETEEESFSDNAKLFLGNIPTQLTKEELLQAFRSKGYKVDIQFPRRRRGTSSSFAFLQFDDEASAVAAMESLNGLELADRKIVARKATSAKTKNVSNI